MAQRTLKTELYFRKRNLREDGDVCQNHQKLDFRRCVYENAPLLPVFRAHRVRVFSDALRECVRVQRRDFTQRERMLHGERTGKMPVVHLHKGRVSQRRCHDVLLLWHRRRERSSMPDAPRKKAAMQFWVRLVVPITQYLDAQSVTPAAKCAGRRKP